MDENRNENNTGYTGEYGNSVEGGENPHSSIYSYSYKNEKNSATHSGDYYANNNTESANSAFDKGQQEHPHSSYYQSDSKYQSENNYQSAGNWQQRNYYQQPDSSQAKPKKKGSFSLKKLGKCAGFAVTFGIIAAVCFEGVIYFSRNVIGINNTKVINNTTASANNNQEHTGNASGMAKPITGSAVSGVTDVSAIVEQTMPSVVAITSTTEGTAYYNLFGQKQSSQDTTSAGTGFIIGQNDTELLIATNNHVIDEAKTISVQFIDEEIYEATVKGSDSGNDLAVVAVKTKNIKSSTMDKIRIADLGNSDDMKVGEMAIAIGNSLGYGQSVTVGYISAKNREITEASDNNSSGNKIEAIQTDAAINPGNSGGPLINLQGQVIGINSAKIASSSVEGVGYAIPISVATPIIDELKNKEVLKDAEKGYLGISGRTVTEEASLYNIPTGVYVVEVSKDGAADKGGIKAGDIITAINNQSVTTIESLQEKANSYRKGTEIEITLQRSNNGAYEEQKLTVKLQGSSSLDGLSNDTDNDSSNNGSNGYNQNNGNDSYDSGDWFGNFFSNPFY